MLHRLILKVCFNYIKLVLTFTKALLSVNMNNLSFNILNRIKLVKFKKNKDPNDVFCALHNLL